MTAANTHPSSSPSYLSCLKRQAKLAQEFNAMPHTEARYAKLMEMGRALPSSTDPKLRSPEYLVSGCQSEVYLLARHEQGNIYFSVHSEALISKGLAALLLAIYNGETIETILSCPPSCIAEMGILASLTPGRSNGLASMHLRMQQEALQFLKKIFANPSN